MPRPRTQLHVPSALRRRKASPQALKALSYRETAALKRVTAEREQAATASLESEARFRPIADTAPVLIWMSSPDAQRTFFKPWLVFTGRTLEQEQGNGWSEGVHPDDLQSCLHTYHSAFQAHQDFGVEYRLRRADGAYRWVLDTGTPRFAANGSFAGYIGSCIDITKYKRMKDTLSRQSTEL